MSPSKIVAVPTNVITGFLGSGKTTAILNLLKQKPAAEKWAVLVNEFGEIGVDGSLVEGQHGENQGVFVREVPGGCMCCAAGVPMQVALNELLKRARPDRLLIEPTGLGHPAEVLAVLSGEHYRNSLDVQKVITLVDARQLADSRYTNHDIFNQQIAIADVVVGNKADLYAEGDEQALAAYVAEHGAPLAKVVITQQAALELALLNGATDASSDNAHHHHDPGHGNGHRHHDHHHAEPAPLASDLPIPESGYLKVENQGEGFVSVGWRFAANKVFNRQKLLTLLGTIKAERIKAVFITDSGLYGYNLSRDGLSETLLKTCNESRIEIIAQDQDSVWEEGLLLCLAS